MNRKLTILVLILNYSLFGVLLNSVGVVILQSINSFGVTKEAASLLEGFKDIPIAVVSFLVASYLPRLGYQKAMSLALIIVAIACTMMPIFANFVVTKLLFLSIGVSFALIKVSVYSTIGLLSNTSKEHASLMNFIEGAFMVGVLSGYWLFAGFINAEDPSDPSWLNAYWVLSGICVVSLVITQLVKIDSSGAAAKAHSADEHDLRKEFIAMLKLALNALVYTFVVTAFLYVLIEQSIQTWLPTFNNEVLKLPASISVQVTSILAACIAIGRLSAGYVSRKVHWFPLINICLVCTISIVVLTLPLSKDVVVDENVDWFSLPIAAYLFPLVGLFLAPIYPILNSVVLSALPISKHSSMTGLIVLFSALGGTTGSMITGFVFSNFSGQTAFYFSIVPMVAIIGLVFLFKRTVSHAERDGLKARLA